MKQQLHNDSTALPYNKAVQEAYFKILKETKNQLATLKREELRYSLEREDRSAPTVGTIIHEMINPLIYLRLECHPENQYAIHFGFEQTLAINQYSQLTTGFLRSLFKFTSTENTAVNIESAIRTDWIITTCSEMYEHVEDNNQHHTFKQIKHKPAAMKRKQLYAA